MTDRLKIDCIWWRNVQPGEFYNIERHHQIAGGGGSLYIEIPSSMVRVTLEFLEKPVTETNFISPITIEARVIGQPNISGPIEFQSKTGGRMRIARQNRQQPNSQRHPAWTEKRGFPAAPDGVASTEEARQYFPTGGIRIYIAKTTEGEYYAGFKKGVRPPTMTQDDPLWELYKNGVGGVIYADWDDI
ncbi:hypothetical protein CWE15_04465 [Aliidiomarina taiwanensis]|uniref:Uncharacterized protein n=1 Tax=Aliidiomarina taiwanensis TaxID=946228 RepID=A0A432X766_9GAMM|nr:hypothetical protein [Aliidiomarina taiwanensis]RUO42672.1 hypothetical protein CWE15_04465 [Aliidiomarina taiwanensis]